jgi:hypothetical protein
MYVYYALVKPFKTPFLNKLEQFNEICILLAVYHLYIFTDLVEDPSIHFNFGWSLIVITILNIAFNMGIILINALKKLGELVKKMWSRIKAKNEKKIKKYKLDEKHFMNSSSGVQDS